jgi:hypothetical protein
VRALTTSGSSGVILAGKSVARGVWTPLVLALDGDGDVEWAVEVDAGSGSTDPDLLGIAMTPAGDVLVVGEVDFAQTPAPPEDTGLACVNTAVQWQRLDEHTVRPLAPVVVPATIDVDPVEELLEDEGIAFGVLVTE